VRINDVNPVCVLSMSDVPVFRAHEGTRVFALVSGVEAVSAAPKSVVAVEQVACQHVAKAETALWLKSLAAGGYGDQLQRQTKGGLTGSDGTSGFAGGVRVTGTDGETSSNGTTGDTSTNGMNPIDPRDFRTSSPPG
jgi:hypothetical protein